MHFSALTDDLNSRISFLWPQQASAWHMHNSWNQFSTTDDESIICFLNVFHRIPLAFNMLAGFPTTKLVSSTAFGIVSTPCMVPIWKQMDLHIWTFVGWSFSAGLRLGESQTQQKSVGGQSGWGEGMEHRVAILTLVSLTQSREGFYKFSRVQTSPEWFDGKSLWWSSWTHLTHL